MAQAWRGYEEDAHEGYTGDDGFYNIWIFLISFACGLYVWWAACSGKKTDAEKQEAFKSGSTGCIVVCIAGPMVLGLLWMILKGIFGLFN